MRHFKKVSPRVQLQLSTGAAIRFDAVDATWGVYRTADAGLIAELDSAIRNEIGGVFAIDEAEYHSLKEQKKTSAQPWRDEITKHGSARTVPKPQNVAVPLKSGDEPGAASAPVAVPAGPPPPPYRPTAAARKT